MMEEREMESLIIKFNDDTEKQKRNNDEKTYEQQPQ
jgi:hypothetical protein